MQGIRERTMKNNFSVLFNTNDTEIVQVIVNSSSNSDFGKKIFMKIKLLWLEAAGVPLDIKKKKSSYNNSSDLYD